MKSIAKNKKAYHDYAIEEKIEAGLQLLGPEVKCLRMGRGNLTDGYAMIRNGQAWLVGFQIPKLPQASYMNHEEYRDKRLLLHRNEIDRLDRSTSAKGYTLVPLEVYFNDEGRIKIELGLAKGKASHDKRDSAKAADAKREIDRALKK